MRRFATTLSLALVTLATVPQLAAAGGSEYPASGTRGLGRGGTDFTRADDPNLMLRNPALLADLWDDQAMAGANLSLVDACFHATGGYGWGSLGQDVSNYGNGPVWMNADQHPGATSLNGTPLKGFSQQPYPQVCYQGPTPILPTVALTKKLSPNVGVGLGFFPPDSAQLNQWGNRDGTVDTPDGRLPSPTRYFGSHLNTSYFSALGAIGYRLADWIRIGAGFQWAAVAYSATDWGRTQNGAVPHNDARVDVSGRDLFIPGIIASAHIVPTDSLDIALGFKWSDRVSSKASLDATTGAFGTGQPFYYRDAQGNVQSLASSVPTTMHNVMGTVNSPPIWAPQLSLGVRYAQRITPRVTTKNWKEAHMAAGAEVQDHMATERWDIEANAIVYLNSVSNRVLFSSSNGTLDIVDAQAVPGGGVQNGHSVVNFPDCTKFDANGRCIGARESVTDLRGKDQLSLRLGGDYNILPGRFTVRAGGSFETDGADVRYLNIRNYMLGRVGLHGGFTFRIAGKTDFSVGFAHFIQKDVRLDPNPATPLPAAYTASPAAQATYNYVPGTHDGVAMLRIPASTTVRPVYLNAGSYFYHLQVVSVTLTQHF